MVVLCHSLSDIDVHENQGGILSNADSDLVALWWVLSFCVSNELPDELLLLSMAHTWITKVPFTPNYKAG